MTKAEREINKAQKNARELEAIYPGASVVWMGGDTFVVCKDGNELTVRHGTL